MKLAKGIKAIIAVIIMVVIGGCAKIVTPTGGPKDEQHPLIEKIEPANYTTNFDAKVVKIKFDEFIQLKDLKESLIVSPLMDTMPEIVVKGKTLQIDIEQTLSDSTTYNIYFGNSVQDYTEGNPIENFQYVFSTGDKVDSLSFQGQVINAFNLLPEKDVYIMLYHNKEDSLPFKQIPNYISRTNEEGFFRINNIKMGTYKVFGLRDINKNYLYDLPDEEIAFTDSIVEFEWVDHLHLDTIFHLDTMYVNDQMIIETHIDSIISYEHSFYAASDLTLLLYKEDRAVQYLTNNKREIRQKLEFMFNKPIKDSVVVELADTIVKNDWFIKELNENKDTLFYWITDSMIYGKEEIQVLLNYQKEDSNLVYQWATDTLYMSFYDKKVKKKKKEKEDIEYIPVALNVRNNSDLDLNKNIDLLFEQPISKINKSRINLMNVVDSIEYLMDFNLEKVQGEFRKYKISSTFPEDSTFKLDIYPGAFTDISGNTNDTIGVQFKIRRLDSYGKLIANISGIDSSYQAICQVLKKGEDEVVLREQVIDDDQIVSYELLEPEEYIFKVILDKNKNGKWDVGDYINHILPEEVLYYENEIKLRANWDFEIKFNLKRE